MLYHGVLTWLISSKYLLLFMLFKHLWLSYTRYFVSLSLTASCDSEATVIIMFEIFYIITSDTFLWGGCVCACVCHVWDILSLYLWQVPVTMRRLCLSCMRYFISLSLTGSCDYEAAVFIMYEIFYLFISDRFLWLWGGCDWDESVFPRRLML